MVGTTRRNDNTFCLVVLGTARRYPEHDRHCLDPGKCKNDLDPESIPLEHIPCHEGCLVMERSKDPYDLADDDGYQPVSQRLDKFKRGVYQECYRSRRGELHDAGFPCEEKPGSDDEERNGQDSQDRVKKIIFGKIRGNFRKEVEHDAGPSQDPGILPEPGRDEEQDKKNAGYQHEGTLSFL